MERKQQHKRLTEREMDSILKLRTAGLKQIEIAELTDVSKSVVSRVCILYDAALHDDWDYLFKATKTNSNIVDWALKKLNKTFPKATVVESVYTPTQENALSLDGIERVETVSLTEIKESLDNIAKILCNLLDMLK